MNSSDAAFVTFNGHPTEETTHPVNVVKNDVENEQQSMKRSNINISSSNTNNNTSSNNINSNDNSSKSQNNINENTANFNNNNSRSSPNKVNGVDKLLNVSYHHYTPEKTRNNVYTKATTPIQQRSFTNANSINVNKQYLHAMNTIAKTARVETSQSANTYSPLRTAVAPLENNYMRSDTVPVQAAATTTTTAATHTSTINTFFPPTYHTMPSNLQKTSLGNNNINNPIINSTTGTNENVNINNNNINNNININTLTSNVSTSNVSNTNVNSIKGSTTNNNGMVNHVRQTRPVSSSQQREAMLNSWAENIAKRHLMCHFCSNVVVNPVQVLPLPVLACRVCARTRAAGGPLSVMELPQCLSDVIQEIITQSKTSHESKRWHPADDVGNHPVMRRRDGSEPTASTNAEIVSNTGNSSNSNNTERQANNNNTNNNNNIINATNVEYALNNDQKRVSAENYYKNEEQQLQEMQKQQQQQQQQQRRQSQEYESQEKHEIKQKEEEEEQSSLASSSSPSSSSSSSSSSPSSSVLEQEEEEQQRPKTKEPSQQRQQQHHHHHHHKIKEQTEEEEEKHNGQSNNEPVVNNAMQANLQALTLFNHTLVQLIEAESSERELIEQKQRETWGEFVKAVKNMMREMKNTPKPPSSRDLKMEADRLYEGGHYEKALDLYNEAIKLQQKDRLTQARFLFGNRSAANFMARHYRDCIDDCLEVIRLEPQNVKMLTRAARAAATMGDLTLAVSIMERASVDKMTEAMRSELQKYKLGLEMYTKAENLAGSDEADELFRMLLAQFPETLLFRERYGASLMKRKHFSKAVDVLEVISAKIRPSKVRYLIADCLYHMGFEYFQRARELLAPAAGIHDDCTHLLHIIDKVEDGKQRGNNHFAQKNFSAAVENYTEAIKFATDNDQILRILYCNRAAANKEIGHFREGVEDCTKALKIDSQFAKAYARRARCHAHLNDPYTAVEDFKRAVELDSEDKELAKELRNAEAILAREAEREKDYYYQLGLARGATEREIRLKYKELSLRWHPDKCVALGNAEKERAEHKFKVISEAYSVLMDPAKRREYELKLDRERYFRPAFQSYSTTFSHSNEYFRGPRHRAGPSGYW